MNKFVVTVVVLAFAFVMALGFGVSTASAAHKVDCAKVMQELNSGKKAKEVAKDLTISTSSVYRCRRRAHGEKTMHHHMHHPAAAPSPAAATH